VIYNPFSFARYDLATLIKTLNATGSSSWSKPYEKQAMLEKIGVVRKLFDDGYYTLAYDMLLHYIKPKLTGLKIDENGTPWGNGVFKHPWIVDPALRSMLRGVIDAALADIKANQEKSVKDVLRSLGSDLVALKNLVDGHLSGYKKDRYDRLISNATILYSAMVAGFQQNKTINCKDIMKFRAIIVMIDAIARNALIRRECNDILCLLGNITRAEFPGFITRSWCRFHHHDHDHHCCGSAVPAVHRNPKIFGENGQVTFSWHVPPTNDSTPITGYKSDSDTSPDYEVYSATNRSATACVNVTSDQAHHHAAGDGDAGDHSRDDHAL
jgi:hypothetical protein